MATGTRTATERTATTEPTELERQPASSRSGSQKLKAGRFDETTERCSRERLAPRAQGALAARCRIRLNSRRQLVRMSSDTGVPSRQPFMRPSPIDSHA